MARPTMDRLGRLLLKGKDVKTTETHQRALFLPQQLHLSCVPVQEDKFGSCTGSDAPPYTMEKL